MSGSSVASVERSPADLLREKHEASSSAITRGDDPQATVVGDDVSSVDLTSSVITIDTAVSSTPASSNSESETLTPAPATASTASKTSSKRQPKEKLDISSLEAFPTLGGGAGKNGAASSIWGSKPNSSSVAKSNGKSRTPLPARSSDVTVIFDFVVSPQSRDRAAFSDAVTKAKELSGVTSIESSTSKSLSTTFIVKGKPESIAIARRALVRALTARVWRSRLL
ncbi:hypothetical protein V1525DRAFT_401890 [Lipomyces kononenkoae]|uniref:Uncharacterized protein n=1 Tax=Lipomyces kononenkoae TaxID=34357 RepID=A0ACC3T3B2_LIPKO